MKAPIAILGGLAGGLAIGGVVTVLTVMGIVPLPFGPAADARAAAEAAKPPATVTLPMQEKILNLADSDRKRYLKVQLALEMISHHDAAGGGGGHGAASDVATVEEELPAVAPVISDTVGTFFSSKTSTELLTPEGKQQAKNELLEGLNHMLHGHETVQGVYFTTFVIQ